MDAMICNGISRYVIIHGTDPCEVFAARELADFLHQSTGVLLPVCEENAGNMPFLSVGMTAALSEAGIRTAWKKQTSDGIRLCEKDGNLYLFGKRPRSTLYAVYDFLESVLDIRFLAPDAVSVPKHDTVGIMGIDKTEEPSFDIRSYFTAQMQNDSLYTARLRQVALYSDEVAEYGYGLEHEGFLSAHNVFDFVSYDEYHQTHPEFFFSTEYADLGGVGWDLCWSQGIDDDGEIIPDSSADILSRNLLRQIEENPHLTWFTVCQNDVPRGCDCPKCQKNIKKYGSHTGILLRYINAVARRVEAWRQANAPERRIQLVTFAYAYTEKPPISADGEILVVPEKNVWIRLATPEQNPLYDCYDARQPNTYRNLVDGWKRVTNRFCYWDYRINFIEYLFYFPSLAVMEADFRFFEELGIVYLFCQATSGDFKDPPIWGNLLKGYVAAKLMWNTGLSTEHLIREFCKRYYEDHADAVLKVISLFENNYERLKAEAPGARFNHFMGYRTVEEDYYPVEMLHEAIEVLKEALEICTNDSMRRRLLNVLCTPERMLLRNYLQYYPEDTTGKEALYHTFIDHCEEAGITMLGGYQFSLDCLREYPDFNWFKMHNIPY